MCTGQETSHPFPRADDTGEIVARNRRATTQQKIDDLRDQLRLGKPARWYSRLTATIGAIAAVEWAALAAHTAAEGNTALDTNLATHQSIFITLNIAACVLGAGWAIWNGQCQREVKRDDIAAHRHELLMEETKKVLATIYRQGDQDALAQLRQTTQNLLNASGWGSESGGSVHAFPQQRR
ncbi:hypothetical protein [Micromonospora wenchangensis]|uniref:hypothetical protein n=1 Tax=Micromonospora wenchangensis TaxID=1185415 RepID=UPI00380BB675